MPPHFGREVTGYLERLLSRKVDRVRWTTCMASWVNRLHCIGLSLWCCMYYTGKLETRQHSIEHINEATAAIRYEIHMLQNIRCSIE
jgi:hypothetical protein